MFAKNTVNIIVGIMVNIVRSVFIIKKFKKEIKMKLIIYIPNDLYNKYKNDNNIDDIHKWNILSFIRKGTPLDKIRAEIEQTAIDYDKFDDYRRVRGLWIALEIIDKYRKGADK